MPEPGEKSRSSGAVWIAVAAAVVVVPMILSVCVPVSRPPDVPSLRTPALAPARPEPAGEPGPDAAPPRAPHEATRDGIASEQAALRIEKAAIEAEELRLRGKRDELEAFERDHAGGAPPELYALYEEARVTFNSDVKAFRARAAAYSMKVAELERRVEALGPDAP